MARPKTAATPQTTAQRLDSVIKSARQKMRKDRELKTDITRLPTLTWLMFLKFLDDLETMQADEAVLANNSYHDLIEPPYRWRDWGNDPAGGRVGSHRFLTCVADADTASADFLRYWFLSEEGLLALNRASPGGAGRNRTLGIKALEAITFPMPSLDAQRWFDRLQAKARAARTAQAEAATHLDRLLPALLHETFGE